jgi:SAM-dependent methyltransferase
MIREGQLFYYEQGNQYWWSRGKYNIVVDLIKHFCKSNIRPNRQNCRILDIGSGPGNMLDFMKDLGEIYGNDTSSDAIEFLKKRNIKVLAGDISKGEFGSEELKFNLITMIDSLEHMEDDKRGLREVFAKLYDGGQIIITAPAYMFLWGRHDEKYGHYRRYTRADLKSKLESAGFIINKISYFEPLFVPVLYFFRMLKNITHSESEDWVALPAWLNKLLLFIVSSEKYLLRMINFPFGATVIAVARKPIAGLTRSEQ